eukprot:scaffold140075_cov247-Phaeocystis_antarctica.AAC.1
MLGTCTAPPPSISRRPPSTTPTRVVQRSLPTASSAYHRCRPRRRHRRRRRRLHARTGATNRNTATTRKSALGRTAWAVQSALLSDLSWTRRGGNEEQGRRQGWGSKRQSPQTPQAAFTAAPSTQVWSEDRGEGWDIGKALGVRVAEADCHEQGTLPSLGVATVQQYTPS